MLCRLNRLATFGQNFPYLHPTAPRRAKVNPLAIPRPTGNDILKGARGDTAWLAALGADDIDIRIALPRRVIRASVKSDPMAIRGPTRGGGKRRASLNQLSRTCPLTIP